MAGDNHTASSLFRRAEQLKRWKESETNRQDYSERPKNNKVTFSSGCIFLAAAAAGDKDEIRLLLDRGADINTFNSDGITALHAACIDQNLSVVEYLVGAGADVNRCDMEGWTPMHATGSCGSLSIAKFLLERGADLSLVNNDGELPVDVADDPDMVAFLQHEMVGRGVDGKAARSREERCMLADATQWLHNGRVEDVPHPTTGATALHVAAAKGYIRVIRLLLEAGVDVNCKDHDGWTPLHAAVHWEQTEAVELLCESSADMTATNLVGQTPLDLANDSLRPMLEEFKRQQASYRNSARKRKTSPGREPSKRKESHTHVRDTENGPKENATENGKVVNSASLDATEIQSWRRPSSLRAKSNKEASLTVTGREPLTERSLSSPNNHVEDEASERPAATPTNLRRTVSFDRENSFSQESRGRRRRKVERVLSCPATVPWPDGGASKDGDTPLSLKETELGYSGSLDDSSSRSMDTEAPTATLEASLADFLEEDIGNTTKDAGSEGNHRPPEEVASSSLSPSLVPDASGRRQVRLQQNLEDTENDLEVCSILLDKVGSKTSNPPVTFTRSASNPSLIVFEVGDIPSTDDALAAANTSFENNNNRNLEFTSKTELPSDDPEKSISQYTAATSISVVTSSSSYFDHSLPSNVSCSNACNVQLRMRTSASSSRANNIASVLIKNNRNSMSHLPIESLNARNTSNTDDEKSSSMGASSRYSASTSSLNRIGRLYSTVIPINASDTTKETDLLTRSGRSNGFADGRLGSSKAMSSLSTLGSLASETNSLFVSKTSPRLWSSVSNLSHLKAERYASDETYQQPLTSKKQLLRTNSSQPRSSPSTHYSPNMVTVTQIQPRSQLMRNNLSQSHSYLQSSTVVSSPSPTFDSYSTLPRNHSFTRSSSPSSPSLAAGSPTLSSRESPRRRRSSALGLSSNVEVHYPSPPSNDELPELFSVSHEPTYSKTLSSVGSPKTQISSLSSTSTTTISNSLTRSCMNLSSSIPGSRERTASPFEGTSTSVSYSMRSPNSKLDRLSVSFSAANVPLPNDPDASSSTRPLSPIPTAHGGSDRSSFSRANSRSSSVGVRSRSLVGSHLDDTYPFDSSFSSSRSSPSNFFSNITINNPPTTATINTNAADATTSATTTNTIAGTSLDPPTRPMMRSMSLKERIQRNTRDSMVRVSALQDGLLAASNATTTTTTTTSSSSCSSSSSSSSTINNASTTSSVTSSSPLSETNTTTVTTTSPSSRTSNINNTNISSSTTTSTTTASTTSPTTAVAKEAPAVTASSTTTTTPSSSSASAANSNVSPNRMVGRSFVPPSRDDESETQRKANARLIRSSRRSTQGVSLDDLKTAETLYKPGGEGQDKFCLEDVRGGKDGTSNGSATNNGVQIRSRTGDDRREDDSDQRNSTGAAGSTEQSREGSRAAIQRRKKPKRRSTGVVHVDLDEIDPEKRAQKQQQEQEQQLLHPQQASESNDASAAASTNVSERGDASKAGSSVSLASSGSTGSDGDIDYKKLYEEQLVENERLVERLRGCEQEVRSLKDTNDATKNYSGPPQQNVTRVTTAETDRREKRALERKLAEMEEELKVLEQLRQENKKLWDENGALIRVISKLSR